MVEETNRVVHKNCFTSSDGEKEYYYNGYENGIAGVIQVPNFVNKVSYLLSWIEYQINLAVSDVVCFLKNGDEREAKKFFANLNEVDHIKDGEKGEERTKENQIQFRDIS